MVEKYGFAVLALGVTLGLVAFLWVVVRAFRAHVLWGLACLLLPPVAVLFCAIHFRKVAGPLVLLVAGGVLVGGTLGLNYYLSHHLDLGQRDKIVSGERHLTLTGWDRADYSVLKQKGDTVVLQMANRDVTDATLEYLQGMAKLRELDLNDTQITDAGLGLLSRLPSLQILRLRGTKITDEAFREYLGDKATLLELDLRETTVASKTLREWKAADKERRKYLR